MGVGGGEGRRRGRVDGRAMAMKEEAKHNEVNLQGFHFLHGKYAIIKKQLPLQAFLLFPIEMKKYSFM